MKKVDLKESYDSAFEICKDGSKCSAIGDFHHTRNYTHELVEFKWKNGSGNGDYKWINRPWQRFTFAEALKEAMIEAGVSSSLAKECIEKSHSLESALKYFAEHCCEDKVEESLNEELTKKEKIVSDAIEAIKEIPSEYFQTALVIYDRLGLSTPCEKLIDEISSVLDDYDSIYDDMLNSNIEEVVDSFDGKLEVKKSVEVEEKLKCGHVKKIDDKNN